METVGQEQSQKVKVTMAVLLLCSCASTLWLGIALSGHLPAVLPLASALGFLLASGLLLRKPKLGYRIGLTAGIVALYWFVPFELRDFPAENSWILFNLPERQPEIWSAGYDPRLRILFVASVVTSISCCLLRLLPASLALRKIPVRTRTWPSFAACLLVMGIWYGVSARPYRIPYIVDSVTPTMVVLHVEKDRLQFHETAITFYHDGQFYVIQNDRRLLQYRFAVYGTNGVQPAITTRAHALAGSLEIKNSRTLPAKALRSWKAEGWYVRTHSNIAAFSTEYGTKPPKEIVDLFRDALAAAPDRTSSGTLTDVCLGFCYDPLAGLGLRFLNDRCKGDNGTRCE